MLLRASSFSVGTAVSCVQELQPFSTMKAAELVSDHSPEVTTACHDLRTITEDSTEDHPGQQEPETTTSPGHDNICIDDAL